MSSRGSPPASTFALEAERRAHLEAHTDLLYEDGRRLVVGHGRGRPRQVTTAAGAVEVRTIARRASPWVGQERGR